MTRADQRLLVIAVVGAVAALAIALIEPRTAASLLGLVFVVTAIAMAIRSLDQLVKRLTDHSRHDATARGAATPRELPQDIDTIRNVVAPLRQSDAMPSPVTVRLREIAASRLSRRFHLDVGEASGRDRLAAVVSPALYAVLLDERHPVPMSCLPGILDELEHL